MRAAGGAKAVRPGRQCAPLTGRSLACGVFLGVCTLLVCTAAALLLLHLCDWLYRYDLRALELAQKTGLDEQVILRNYHAVMRWLWPFSPQQPFSLPDLAFSEQGAIHFADCRRLFGLVYGVGALCAAAIALLLRADRRRPLDRRAFFTASLTLLLCLALVGAAMAADASAAFVLFHKLLFRNDFWQFDPAKDPVIRLLPEQFFYHCAAVFLLFWLLGAALLWAAGKRRLRTLRQAGAAHTADKTPQSH